MSAADALVHSKEMNRLVGSSVNLVVSAVTTSRNIAFRTGGLVVDAALLPVTIPLKVATTTTGLLLNVAGSVVDAVVGDDASDDESQASSQSPMDGFIRNVFNFIPFVLDTAGKLTNEVGSAAVHAVTPSLAGSETQDPQQKNVASPRWSPSKETEKERAQRLQRLRLDFQPIEEQQPPVTKKAVRAPSPTDETSYSRATPSDVSKNLMRVDDIIVMVYPKNPALPKARPRKSLFVDIGSDFADDSITKDALAKLIQRGMDVSATNKSAHMALPDCQINTSIPIDWKPEGQTGRHSNKMAQLKAPDVYSKLMNHVLVWSGKYNGPKYYGSHNPLFLARGVVRRSPRGFFDMLWDSDRTGEYNNFSLGRSDIHVIDDSISSTGDSGAKVIKSETRVPFAGLTVSLSALMHGKKFKEGNNEEAYVIVSRSVTSGMAGCHVGSSKRVEQNTKNEILLGVNIMRPVPGHPELCDLMSVSQVSSSMVPPFLAFRIGMLGVEDFFKNVRS